jgi:hypothetical protein
MAWLDYIRFALPRALKTLDNYNILGNVRNGHARLSQQNLQNIRTTQLFSLNHFKNSSPIFSAHGNRYQREDA